MYEFKSMCEILLITVQAIRIACLDIFNVFAYFFTFCALNQYFCCHFTTILYKQQLL